MGGGIPGLSSIHRAASLRHYIIFRKTCHSFLLHLQLVRPHSLIPVPYALLLLPAHDLWGSYLSLLHHQNVRNIPRRNLLGQTFVAMGVVLLNCPHTRVRQHLTNGRVLTFTILVPRHPSRNSMRYPIIQACQRPQNVEHYDPRLRSEKQNRLYHLHVEPPRGPGVIPLRS